MLIRCKNKFCEYLCSDQDTQTKPYMKLALDDLHWLKLVTMATSDDVRISYQLFLWQPSWIRHLGFSNAHSSKAKQSIFNKLKLMNDFCYEWCQVKCRTFFIFLFWLNRCILTGTPSWSSVCILFCNVTDFHNYKVLYRGKILFLKTAKFRLIFNKNYLPVVCCCSFIALCFFSPIWGDPAGF